MRVLTQNSKLFCTQSGEKAGQIQQRTQNGDSHTKEKKTCEQSNFHPHHRHPADGLAAPPNLLVMQYCYCYWEKARGKYLIFGRIHMLDLGFGRPTLPSTKVFCSTPINLPKFSAQNPSIYQNLVLQTHPSTKISFTFIFRLLLQPSSTSRQNWLHIFAILTFIYLIDISFRGY